MVSHLQVREEERRRRRRRAVFATNDFPHFLSVLPFPLHLSTRRWVLVSNPALLSFDPGASFLCHLPSQLLMKSIGAVNGGGCGSGVGVFAHRVAVQHGAGCFIAEATDGGGVALYPTAGVSRKGRELTPPLAHLETTHQLVSPQRIHTEDDTNSRKLIKGKLGWRRCVRLIAPSQFRRYGVRCGCRGSCHKRGWMWAAKPHVSWAWVVVGRERGCGHRNHMFQRLSKVPIVRKNEFGGCEIEIAKGVVISTPPATHLIGLPHQGSPLSFLCPSTSAPLLQNIAHISW